MTLTTFLSDLNEIMVTLANIFVNAMSIFMEPPLIIFVEISIFIVMFAILNKRFLRYNIGKRVFK
jgi:hypothetical protein